MVGFIGASSVLLDVLLLLLFVVAGQSAPVFGCVGQQIASKYGCSRHADGLPMARHEPRLLQIIFCGSARASVPAMAFQ